MGESDKDALLKEIRDELSTLSRKIESAFMKDEYGNPDYFGHRRFHTDQEKQKKSYEDSKKKVLSNIITWASIGLLTVILNGLAQYYGLFIKAG